ncbi:MAG TPA: urease subunit beta [Lentisphaeria bacterium]|nr:MAG: urease subunit beta [Lentisphaerae bacterium GWF2_38_69]HBM16673.1 urease subunit beta [Lentisphaeria bacterium]
MKPGEIISGNPTIILNKSSEVVSIEVINTGDRPVQVGSHFHFFEVNRFLRYPRKMGFGCRLNIPSGTAVRFEPGEKKEIELIKFRGAGQVFGFNNLSEGSTDPENLEKAMAKLKNNDFYLD